MGSDPINNTGVTTVSVFQEFFINMLLSNLASLIKNQADDEELLISPRSSNKYRYQANRAFVIGRMKRILPKILCSILKLSSVDQLFQDSLRCRSQIMPGRAFRRKKAKRREELISIIKKLLFDHHFLYFFMRLTTALIKMRLFLPG